jgi:AcrR family transcriptional regulator
MPVTDSSGRAEAARAAADVPVALRRKEHIRNAAVTDILAAAEAMFARAGFSGTTMAEIADLAHALGEYIRAKMRLTATHRDASRVFANEMLHGAPNIGGYLRNELKALVDEKSRVIDHWAQRGLMDRVDARHLFFTIWAATQTYADFQPQVCAVLGKTRLTRAELDHAAAQLVRIILRGCGVRGSR